MLSEKDKINIQEYFDGELERGNEVELFSLLALNDEARDSLFEMQTLATGIETEKISLKSDLPDNFILNDQVNKSKSDNLKLRRSIYRPLFYISAAASIVFAMLLLSNFIKENSFESKYQNLQTEFITIEEKYNSVQSEKAELIKINKTITEQKNILKLQYAEVVKQSEENIDKKVKAKLKNAYQMGNEYLTILADIPTVKLTEEDYLAQ